MGRMSFSFRTMESRLIGGECGKNGALLSLMGSGHVRTGMEIDIIPVERIQQAIYLIRGKKVMLDRDLALLYAIPTKALKQAVRRNPERFPNDFMFVLDSDELSHWRSQFVTSKEDRKGLRYAPMAFTEQGVAMLSSVLNSPRAVQVNIAIMRTFVRLRELMTTHEELARKIEEMEKKYDSQFRVVFEAIRELIEPPKTKRKEIGFHAREEQAPYIH
jgi:hypothetical protein